MKPTVPKILVIDDDARLRELLVRYLTEQIPGRRSPTPGTWTETAARSAASLVLTSCFQADGLAVAGACAAPARWYR
jgi:DNA-binding response OmpR family regulator